MGSGSSLQFARASQEEVEDSWFVAALRQRLHEVLFVSARTFTSATDRLQLLSAFTTATRRLCEGDRVVLVAWRVRQTNFHRREELVHNLVSRVAQHLVRIRPHHEHEHHLHRSESLRPIRSAITSTLDPSKVLQLAAEEGARLAQCETGEFERIKQRTTLQPRGVGLGLVVCKKLTYFLGGAIHDRKLSSYSTCTRVLPFSQYENSAHLKCESAD